MIMYYENFKNCEDFVNSFDGLSKDDKQRYIEESLLFEEFIMDCRLKSEENFLHRFVETMESLQTNSEEIIKNELKGCLRDMSAFALNLNNFLTGTVEIGKSLIVYDENDLKDRLANCYINIMNSLAKLTSLVNLSRHRASIALYKLYGEDDMDEKIKEMADGSPEKLWVVRNEDGSVNYIKSLQQFDARSIYELARETEYEE